MRIDPRSRSRVKLRLVIADDNASVREGLREMISAEDDLSLVGVAADGAEALRLITEHRPDVVVLDNEMPVRSGLSVLRAVREDLPQIAIVMFTLDDGIRELALESGAAAVLPKDPIETCLPRSGVRRQRPPNGRAAKRGAHRPRC